jgi:hypothetical protein|tara:strand:- start:5597 stop:6214 length:618 start_codon:yes stop_codon:yes gene_type:complete
MNVYDIVNEDKKIDEAPTSGIGNAVKGLVGKLPGAERMAGSAEMGKEANTLYKTLKKWQGINGKNDKNMTAQDFAQFMKQNNLSAGGMALPDGILPKKTIMDVLKQAARNKLTGGNAAAAPKGKDGKPVPAGGGGAPAGGGGILDKMQAKTGNSGVGGGSKSGTTTNAPGTKANAGGKPGKITAELQAKIDKLNDAQKKSLAGML